MYDLPSVVIAAVLFVTMAVVIELGYRAGTRFERQSTEPVKGHTTAIQGALLGILGLLLGFTFSLSLQRYDSRSQAVVTEANAIGTAYLRTRMLPAPVRASARASFRRYVDLRVESGFINLAHESDRQKLVDKTNATFNDLWEQAATAAEANPNPVTTGLYVQALNDMIDAFGERDAALERHVPEVVLFLLYGAFLLTGLIIGFTAGLSGHRASFATYVMVGLIVLLVFIIIDLDRPRRGLIQVSQQPMLSLRSSIDADTPPPHANR